MPDTLIEVLLKIEMYKDYPLKKIPVSLFCLLGPIYLEIEVKDPITGNFLIWRVPSTKVHAVFFTCEMCENSCVPVSFLPMDRATL